MTGVAIAVAYWRRRSAGRKRGRPENGRPYEGCYAAREAGERLDVAVQDYVVDESGVAYADGERDQHGGVRVYGIERAQLPRIGEGHIVNARKGLSREN